MQWLCMNFSFPVSHGYLGNHLPFISSLQTYKKRKWLHRSLAPVTVIRKISLMSNIDGFAIATLILFFLSTFFVIRPLSFHVPLPLIGRTRITIGLMTAPIIAILILWAAQCIGATEIRDGIVGTGPFPPILCLIALKMTLFRLPRWRQTLQHSDPLYIPCVHGDHPRYHRNSSSRRILGQQSRRKQGSKTIFLLLRSPHMCQYGHRKRSRHPLWNCLPRVLYLCHGP